MYRRLDYATAAQRTAEMSQSALVTIITVLTKEYGLIRLLNEFMPSKDSPTVN
jgi:hypothetical protein